MPRQSNRLGRTRPTSGRASASRAGGENRTRTLLAAFLLIIGGAIAYANSLSGPFVFDDRPAIIDNTTIRQLWPPTALHPPKQTPLAGRPLPNLTFAVNYAAGGVDVLGYHLVNVAIHIAAALVLFGLLRRLLARTVAWYGSGASADTLAFVCAAAWLVHPLNTEAVDYLTQRTECLMGLLFLLAMYASVRSWETARAWRWRAITVAAAIGAMASKETAATLPLVVALCDWAFSDASARETLSRRWTLYAAMAAGWLLPLLFIRDTPFFSATGFTLHVSRSTYLLNQAPAIARYLELSVWPHALVLDYGIPQSVSLPSVMPAVALVLLLLTGTFVALWRWPRLGFWGAWFFITLAPSSGLVPIPTEVAAERRMYLPLVAVIVLFALGSVAGAGRLLASAQSGPARSSRAFGNAAWAAAVIVLIALGAATMQRNGEYQSVAGLWQSVIDRQPSPRAHSNLAIALRDEGRDDEAVAHLRIAAPDWPDARHALGSALRERGDERGAIAELEEFVKKADPNDPEIASAQGEIALARRALLIDLLKRQQFAQAEQEARQLIAYDAANAEAHNLLGVALASRGRIGDAGKEFAEAVRLNPQYTEARNNLARATSGR